MFAEDLTAFFNAAEHGTAASLDGLPVVGIFGNAFADAYGISSREVLYTLPTASCSAVTISSTLVVGSATYRVASIQPDGTGVTTLVLEITS